MLLGRRVDGCDGVSSSKRVKTFKTTLSIIISLYLLTNVPYLADATAVPPPAGKWQVGPPQEVQGFLSVERLDPQGESIETIHKLMLENGSRGRFSLVIT